MEEAPGEDIKFYGYERFGCKELGTGFYGCGRSILVKEYTYLSNDGVDMITNELRWFRRIKFPLFRYTPRSRQKEHRIFYEDVFQIPTAPQISENEPIKYYDYQNFGCELVPAGHYGWGKSIIAQSYGLITPEELQVLKYHMHWYQPVISDQYYSFGRKKEFVTHVVFYEGVYEA